MSVRALLRWTLGVALLFSVIYTLGSSFVAALLTDTQNVREGVADMRLWLTMLPLLSAWAFIYDGFFVGITKTDRMMLATLVASVVFYIVAFLRISPSGLMWGVPDNNTLWTAFLSYLTLRGAILAVIWRFQKLNTYL